MMQPVTNGQMRQLLAQSKADTVVLLKHNPACKKEAPEKILWEHGRRNFQLRAEGE